MVKIIAPATFVHDQAKLMISWRKAHALAMSLPDAEERDHFGSPSFRVGGKIFAQLSAADHDPPRALVKLSGADQTALILSDPETFSSVPSWGRRGWTYIRLGTVDPAMLRDLLWQSWRLVAPKKFIAACVARDQ